MKKGIAKPFDAIYRLQCTTSGQVLTAQTVSELARVLSEHLEQHPNAILDLLVVPKAFVDQEGTQ